MYNFNKFFLLCFKYTGLVASQEETTTARNFLHRKIIRNNRPKPKPKSTTPVPTEDESDDDGAAIRTASHCPEPDGFFADSEQCDKYYACRYTEMVVHSFGFFVSFFFFVVVAWILTCCNDIARLVFV